MDDPFATTDSVEGKADIRMPSLCAGCSVSRVAPSGGTLISEEFQTTSSWTTFFVLGRKKISGIVHIIALTTATVMRDLVPCQALVDSINGVGDVLKAGAVRPVH